MSPVKRTTKQPDRYGSCSTNLDDMFDDADKTTSKCKDPDFQPTEEQSSDTSSSDASVKNPCNEHGSHNALQRQMARVEVKLNELFSIVMQIHRANISNAASTQMESENFPELPLKSDDALNKFELDLAQKLYREKIVSHDFFQFRFVI